MGERTDSRKFKRKLHIHAAWVAGLLCLLISAFAAAAEGPDIERLRAEYVRAEQALRQGDRPTFRRLLNRLRNYPLYPYLRFADLRRRLGAAGAGEIDAFLNAFADTPLAHRLRLAWLRSLARRRQWQTYLRAYRPDNGPYLECYYRRALLAAGRRDAALADLEGLWLTGRSLSRNCDPVLAAWVAAGDLTDALAWRRIRLAMEAGHPRLARYLGRYLPRRERARVNIWYKVYRRPMLLLKPAILRKQDPISAWIVMHGLQRLARLDADQAARVWPQVARLHPLKPEQAAATRRSIALALAFQGRPDALDWLAKVPANQADQPVRFWRVRAALARQDWPAVLHWLDRLQQDEQRAPRWRYWRARALAALGQQRGADAIYRRLAETRSYEGFLAADRLGTAYHFQNRPLQFSAAELAAVENIPGILRARELLFLDQDLDARREWYAATAAMDDGQLRRAAKLAQSWDWYDRAILTLGQSRYRNDLALRFPVVHEQLVLHQSNQAGVDPAWAFAVMRKESAFNPDARSHRGAIGLMQLLPRTARRIAGSLNIRMRGNAKLYRTELNIRFGVTYLRKVLDRFGNHPVLATAAYNAGGFRVRSWLPTNRAMPADIWVETIPFGETRNYLRSVLAYTAIYERRLGRTPTPLKLRMPPVAPPPGSLSSGAQARPNG